MHLLQLEWKKLKAYRPFRVMSIMYLVLLPIGYVSVYYFFDWTMSKQEVVEDVFKSFVTSLTAFPKVWQPLAYGGSWFTFFFLGYLGVNLISMEYSNRTLRQTIINGLSRRQFFLGKIYMMLAISAAATLVYAIIGTIVGFIFTDYIFWPKVFQHIDMIPRFFLQSFGFMSFAMLLAILIKRSGVTIMLYLAYSVIEMIWRYAFHMNVFGQVNAMNYYPMNVLEDLAPQPIPEAWMPPLEEGFDYFLSPNLAVGLSLMYIAIFLGLGYWAFQRRDL